MCWLYFVLNLLVIQHLETLYLGENNVRVMCERVWRFDQECATRRWLVTRTCNWLASGDLPKWSTRVEHVGSWKVRTVGSLHDKKYNLAILLSGDWNSRLVPVVSDVPVHLVLLINDFSHSFSYPTINTLIPTKYRELLEKILKEKSQRTTRLIHPQSYTVDFSNSSTLTISIVITLRWS